MSDGFDELRAALRDGSMQWHWLKPEIAAYLRESEAARQRDRLLAVAKEAERFLLMVIDARGPLGVNHGHVLEAAAPLLANLRAAIFAADPDEAERRD